MGVVAKDVKHYQPAQLHAESPDQTALMAIISRAATDPNFDTDRLMKLLELKERYDATEARKAFTVAMASFKADPPKIVKNKHVAYRNNKGGTTEYDHATHSEVTEKIAGGLGAHGLSHRWNVEQSEGRIRVTCVITHALGHSEQVALTAAADDSGSKNAIQAVGSTITYLQRYTLLAATGLTSADMDHADNDGGGVTLERPPLPPDVITALKDASLDGKEALARVFKGLSEATRGRIVADYAEEWSALKADAAKVQS